MRASTRRRQTASAKRHGTSPLSSTPTRTTRKKVTKKPSTLAASPKRALTTRNPTPVRHVTSLVTALPSSKRSFSRPHTRTFTSQSAPDEPQEYTTTIKINQPAQTLAHDPLAHSSIDSILSKTTSKPLAAKRPSKQRLEKEKKQNDRLVDTLYGDFVDANDRGDGLVWAGGTESAIQVTEPTGAELPEDNSTPLHEQILQLYLNNYQEQETRELEAHFEGGKQDNELAQGRDQFLQQIVNTLTPKNYSRFVHAFRMCIQKLRTLLAKHQQQKQHLKDNIHMITNLAFQESNLQMRYQSDLQEVQIAFFRQAAKLFGEHSDVFMPQLVIYLSSLTLTQLENHRERQSTSQMNLYSCGFWTPHEDQQASAAPLGSGDGLGVNPTASFREQFHSYLEENNPTANTKDYIPAQQVALEAYTFPVRIANKLYADLDIHTDQTSPLFFNKLARTHKRSYKVFVSNIPSTLTTRELMALFGNCGVLNAAEIYRDKLDQNSGSTLENPLMARTNNLNSSMPGDDSLYQGLSLSKKEAILQANTAALTIDISDIALGHFTSSFKSERLLVPSHVIDGKLIENAVNRHSEQFQRLLGSDGQPMDPAASVFLQQDGSTTSMDPFFSDTIQENFQSELQKFENLHTKRVQRQQRKASAKLKDDAPEDSPELEQPSPPQLQPPPGSIATPHNPLAAYNFKPAHTQVPMPTPQPVLGGAKSSTSEIDKFKVRNLHSPVYGFLYFATPAGKRRALKQALRVFGLSTASGYAMTTQDALEKSQLIISGLHRSMSGADVAHFIRETLGQHMSLSKAIDNKSLISTNAMDVEENSQAQSVSAKSSIIERVYVPRSYARSIGSQDFFNNNRGYAIVTFDSHESAFNAFRYLQNSSISFTPANSPIAPKAIENDEVGLPLQPQTARIINSQMDDDNDGSTIEKIDPKFNMDTISTQFNQALTSTSESQIQPANAARIVTVHWRQEKSRAQKQQHPITSYFPTFERPKQHLFHKVSQQLKAALPDPSTPLPPEEDQPQLTETKM